MRTHTLRQVSGAAAIFACCATCLLSPLASVSAEEKLRIQTDFVPPGSHRLGQVVESFKREELLAADVKLLIDVMANSGVDTAQLRDGSVVVVILNCCGGKKQSESTARLLYVPPDITVEPGDIVEYRVGHPSDKKQPGELNTVVQIRERAADLGTHCRWDPPNDRLWMRILYCDWMPAEGWVKKNLLYKTWCKLPAQ